MRNWINLWKKEFKNINYCFIFIIPIVSHCNSWKRHPDVSHKTISIPEFHSWRFDNISSRSVYNAGNPGSIPVGKIPWRRKWQSTPVLLPGKSHGQGILVGYSPWGRKESHRTQRPHFHFPSSRSSSDNISSRSSGDI